MKPKRTSRGRWWKILLVIHLICYEIFFLYVIFDFTMWYSPQREFIILLMWTPALLIHVGATYYYIGRSDIEQQVRDAYQEGFIDAAHQLADRSYDAPRLSLSDDGELIEVPEKRKREV